MDDEEREQRSTADTILLLLVADEVYAPHLATTIRSVDLSRGESQVEAFVVSIGVTDESRRRVERSAPGVPITWVDLPSSAVAGLPKSSGGTHNNAYGLLFAPDLLPQSVQRVIALDSDMLVRSDLNSLWRFELDGALAAGVRDGEICWLAHPDRGLPTWRELGLDGRLPYLNTGVLVLDVEAWRRHDLTARCMRYLDQYASSVRFADQDALNAVLAGQWRELSACWNVLGDLDLLRFTAAAVNDEELADAKSQPRIVHYAGGLKPWRWDRGRRAGLLRVDEWEQAALGTEFRDFYVAQRTDGLDSLAPRPLWRRVVGAARRRPSKAWKALRSG